jgi:hypothetical protein
VQVGRTVARSLGWLSVVSSPTIGESRESVSSKSMQIDVGERGEAGRGEESVFALVRRICCASSTPGASHRSDNCPYSSALPLTLPPNYLDRSCPPRVRERSTPTATAPAATRCLHEPCALRQTNHPCKPSRAEPTEPNKSGANRGDERMRSTYPCLASRVATPRLGMSLSSTYMLVDCRGYRTCLRPRERAWRMNPMRAQVQPAAATASSVVEKVGQGR